MPWLIGAVIEALGAIPQALVRNYPCGIRLSPVQSVRGYPLGVRGYSSGTRGYLPGIRGYPPGVRVYSVALGAIPWALGAIPRP